MTRGHPHAEYRAPAQVSPDLRFLSSGFKKTLDRLRPDLFKFNGNSHLQ
jgi:hypothetical protein